MAALFAVSSTRPAQAQAVKAKADATTDVTMIMGNFVELEATPTVTLTPSLADIIDNNYIEALQAITLTLRTNNMSGAAISAAIRFDASALDNKIAPTSFSLQGGTQSSGIYTGLSTDETPISNYTESTMNLPGGETQIPLDLKVGDLQDYPAKAGLATNYTNTIVFTAVAND